MFQDYIIEVAKEGDVCRPFQDLKDVTCDKNPGHKEFIPFLELKLNDLPLAYRTVEKLHQIKHIGKRVVRIVVNNDSGTQISWGTGFVFKKDNKYYIQTNNHVIKDVRDAKNSVIEFNFDSYDSEKIYCIGVDIHRTCPVRDMTQILFEPTEFLNSMDIVDVGILDPTIEITYINGNKIEEKYFLLIINGINCAPINVNPNDPEIKDISVKFVDGTVSNLISPYITFRPIPDNIQSFSHQMSGYHHPTVELVPAEGEDTIPLQGEIIYSFNVIIIKLSQSLTKQEAENCLIYFPDGSVSRGIGLCFEVDTNFIRSYINGLLGNDLNVRQRAYGSNKLHDVKLVGEDTEMFKRVIRSIRCLAMFKPIPSYITTLMKNRSISDNEPMVVISHPHGTPKVVTFGKCLGGKFQNNAGQTIECIRYSCNTCPGSSGAPVCSLKCILVPGTPHFSGRPAWDLERYVLDVNNVNISSTP